MYGGRIIDDFDRRIVRVYMDEYMGDFLFDTFQPFHFYRDSNIDYKIPMNAETQEDFIGKLCFGIYILYFLNIRFSIYFFHSLNFNINILFSIHSFIISHDFFSPVNMNSCHVDNIDAVDDDDDDDLILFLFDNDDDDINKCFSCEQHRLIFYHLQIHRKYLVCIRMPKLTIIVKRHGKYGAI